MGFSGIFLTKRQHINTAYKIQHINTAYGDFVVGDISGF